MDVYTCTGCNELFKVIYLSGEFPGGKERENIDCPSCGKNAGSEVTSAVLSTKALTDQERATHLAGGALY